LRKREAVTEQEHPTQSDPTSGQIKKGILSGFVISLEIAAIAILIILIYDALFPKPYWQSRELEQNLTKWESKNIRHYRMSVFIGCFCEFESRMPLEVEVRDEKVISVTDAQGLSVPPDDELRQYYPYALTIEGLFRYAYGSIWNEYEASASYDPELGYPKGVGVDRGPGVDDEIGFRVENLKILPP
jgi:hypothetical protein